MTNFFDRQAAHTVVIPFTPATYDEAFAESFGGSGSILSSRPLSPSRSEAIPIVSICTRVVSEDIAKVSLHINESLGYEADGRSKGKRRAFEHEWYDALHHESNEYQTAIDMREMMTAFALNRGRGIAEKRTRRVGRTRRRELVPLHPDLVSADPTSDGDMRWAYDDPRKGRRHLLPDEVLVVWGPRRRSVISFLREQLAIMAAAQDLRSQMYKRGPRHTGVIARPKDAPKWGEKGRENFRAAIDEYMGEGERAGRPLLLEDGMTWSNSGFSLKDTEFLATANLDNALICGAYRVPQHKAGLLERSTNNNIQQQATDYVVDCLLAWAVRWEQAIRQSLLVDPFSAEHNLRTLLRGDPKTSAETHAVYYAIGTETGNEIRDDEGRNPLDGLDEPRVALNMDVPGVANAHFAEPALLAAEATSPTDPTSERHRRALVRDGAGRVVRKEVQTLAKLAERHEGAERDAHVRAFFAEHVDFVAKVLRIDDEQAALYCAARCEYVLASGDVDPDTAISALTTFVLSPEETAA
jgi:HK97 family phage portal protein